MIFRLLLIAVGIIIIGSTLFDGLKRIRKKTIDPFSDLNLTPKQKSAMVPSPPATSTEKEQGNQLNLFDSDSPFASSLTLNVTSDTFALQLVAPQQKIWIGNELFRVLVKYGCRYEKDQLFHGYRLVHQHKEHSFSVASLIQPGTFIITQKNFFTKGLLFFLPDALPRLENFELMLSTAKSISRELNGILLNRERQILTESMIHQYRKKLTYGI